MQQARFSTDASVEKEWELAEPQPGLNIQYNIIERPPISKTKIEALCMAQFDVFDLFSFLCEIQQAVIFDGSAQLNLIMNAQYQFRVACRNLYGISLYRLQGN